ncbi:MAG: TonB-dependent receptor [Kangiellaceae bacterium]|nr:TonB-dependent receptor [Kangiellaceae bacterium]
MKKHSIATWVGMALSSTALLGPTDISAAEPLAEEEQKITITGSRIKRVDMEGATPVTVITAEDIEAMGFQTVSDVLRNNNLNSFGSWGGGANNGWSSQSTVSLKGAGIRYTLVLIDGHRMAKSAVLGGGAANLNTIPTAAVERIDILTDGASAIYGTDAMAGVINIILKKDYEGLGIELSSDQTEREGGEYSKISFSGGVAGQKGSATFFFEHDDRAGIFDRDRDYSGLVQFPDTDPRFIQSYSTLSFNSRNIWRSSDGSWAGVPMVANEDCTQYNINGETGFHGAYDDADYAGDRVCGYNYTNESGMWSGVVRDSFTMTSRYEINNDLEFGFRTTWTSTETTDVSAPSTAFWYFPDDLPGYTTDEGVELTPIFAGDSASYRLNTLGNRVAEHTDILNDVLLTLEGSTDSFEWQTSYQYAKNRRNVWGSGYAMTGAIPDFIGSWDTDTNSFVGWDPRDPNSPIPAAISANFDKKDEYIYEEITVGASFDVAELDAGAVTAYIGASSKEEELTSLVDAQAEAGRVAGGNGGSSGEGLERSSHAVFGELLIPIIDDLEVSLAVRHDSYSDFGSKTIPMLRMSYRPTQDILLRASTGKGFFAPTLTDLYTTGAQSFYNVVDTPYYQAQAQAAGQTLTEYCNANSCGARETEHHIGGNPLLDAEESESFNVGFVWDVTDEFGFRIDYFALKIDNKITELSGSTVLDIQAANPGVDVSTLLPGAAIHRLPSNDPNIPGRIDYIDTPTVNFGSSEQSGVDLAFNYSIETSIGKFVSSFGVSHMFEYKTIDEDGSFDWIGRTGTPAERANLGVRWSNGNHSANLYSYWIGSQEDTNDDGDIIRKVGSHVEHNASYSYKTSWDAEFTLGVRNLTDEDPEFANVLGVQTTTWNSSLYSPQGRSVYVTAKFEF